VVGVHEFRDYKVELWPVGNRFEAGHRIRLSVVGSAGRLTQRVVRIR